MSNIASQCLRPELEDFVKFDEVHVPVSPSSDGDADVVVQDASDAKASVGVPWIHSVLPDEFQSDGKK
jgi:hypothetical protein